MDSHNKKREGCSKIMSFKNNGNSSKGISPQFSNRARARLVKKFEKADSFDQAFALWPAKSNRLKPRPVTESKQTKL